MSVRKNNCRNQKGFTLVELAIVLVIIGLIVSSVLVGQDLINAAQLRATTRQLNEFETAVGTFIGKYNGIPGDLNNGGKFGLTGTAAYQDGTVGDGDGNGTLTITNSASAITNFTGEMSTFWSHLTTPGKGLIPGEYDGTGCGVGGGSGAACVAGEDFPAMKVGVNGWGVYGVSGVNYYVAGVTNPGPGTAAITSTTNSFLPMDAYNIDSKIDDGVPNAGNVQVLGGHGSVITTAASTNSGVSADHCINDTPAPDEYQFTAGEAQCVLRFRMTTY